MSADTVTPAERSRIMKLVRSRDTKPEMYVRRALHAAGFRFRLHSKRLPGRPDIALRKHKTVVFVHGCLWHWHGCKRSRMPATNTEFWQSKISRTQARDTYNMQELANAGWRIEIIWECELREATHALIARLHENSAF